MTIADWSDLFVAAAGASAALAGLIIVAMSVNIEVIVKYPTLPSRAGATIALLVLVTLASIVGLVPGIPVTWTGWAVVAFSLGGLAFCLESSVRMFRDREAKAPLYKSAVLVIPALAFLVGGGMLVAGDVAGLYFVVVGMLLAFIGTIVNAWVLLVEIRR